MAGEREGLLVARGVVLADGGEALVLVTDEDGRAKVAVGVLFHLGGAFEKGLEPGVLEKHPSRPGQRGRGACGHVERQDLPALDELVNAGEPLEERSRGVAGGSAERDGPHGRPPPRRRGERRGRTEDPGNVGEIKHGEKDADPFNDRGAQLGVQREPIVLVPAIHGTETVGVVAGRRDLVDPERKLEAGEVVGNAGIVGDGDEVRRRCPPVFLELGVVFHPELVVELDELGGGGAGEGTGLGDAAGEELRINRTAIYVLEGAPVGG